jgi:hypothetical protein
MRSKPLSHKRLRRFHWSNRSIALLLITGLIITFPDDSTSKGPDILGLSLGMDQAEVTAALQAKGITPSQEDQGVFTATSLPVRLEGVTEAKCTFEDKKLIKIKLLFDIPPHEASAATLIQQYENEKDRLRQQFGAPSKDVISMNAPTVQERYDWLKRGRGYYLSAWEKTDDKLKVTLWLYGEDAGIVLMEVYERQ